MIDPLVLGVDSVDAQRQEGRRSFLVAYAGVLSIGLLIAIFAAKGFGNYSDALALSLAILACGAGAILLRPYYGVYLTIFFSVLGDSATMSGYPFNLNFSSRESFLYLHDSLTFTPIELYLAITFVGWFINSAGARSWRVHGQPALGAVLAFGGFLLVGLAWGVARGGSLYVAIWEIRPLLYLVAMYFLVANLFTKTSQYVRLAWLVVLAVSIQNVFALNHYYALAPNERANLESLTEHPISLLYGWMFLLTMAFCMLRGCSRRGRVLLLLASLPSAWVFVLSQRRGAVVGLLAGFLVFAVILFFRRRKAFMVAVPLIVLLTAGYTAAFWNASTGIGFGARAIKTVVAPDEVSDRDNASDVYRQIENFDLNYTIRAQPVTGVGFGQPFYQPTPLPNISFFVFYQYISHNQLLWIWLKTGFLGFVSLFVLIAISLRSGVRAALTIPSGDVLAVTVGALAFVVMFIVFAFVDICWISKMCLFLAACIATCANIERVSREEAERDGGGVVEGSSVAPANPNALVRAGRDRRAAARVIPSAGIAGVPVR